MPIMTDSIDRTQDTVGGTYLGPARRAGAPGGIGLLMFALGDIIVQFWLFRAFMQMGQMTILPPTESHTACSRYL